MSRRSDGGGRGWKIRYDLKQRTAYRFSVIANWQTRALAKIYVRKHGLTVNGWLVLCVVGHYSRLSASDVVGHTTLDAIKVTRAVDALVSRGLVHREQDSSDRRKVVLTLSEKGQRIFKEVEAARRILEYNFLTALTPAELEKLYTILDKLVERGRHIFAGQPTAGSRRQPTRKLPGS